MGNQSEAKNETAIVPEAKPENNIVGNVPEKKEVPLINKELEIKNLQFILDSNEENRG